MYRTKYNGAFTKNITLSLKKIIAKSLNNVLCIINKNFQVRSNPQHNQVINRAQTQYTATLCQGRQLQEDRQLQEGRQLQEDKQL